MGFFLHRFGFFSTPFGVEKTPKAAQEKMTTGKAQHAKTFLKELHCSGKEGFFSTPLWGFYYTIYGVFSTPLWVFFYSFMGFLLPFTQDLMPRDIMSSQPRRRMAFGQLVMPQHTTAQA